MRHIDATAIDVHAHYFPSTYLRAYEAQGDVVIPNWQAATLARQSLRERYELMERAGVGTEILSLALAQPYNEDRRTALRLAELGNAILAETCRESGGKDRALCVLPLPDVDASLEMLAACLDEMGFVGVSLGCSVLGRDLDDCAFAPLYEELDARGAAVVLHPVMRPCCRSVGELGLSRTLGGVLEDTIAAVRLVVGGVVSRYKNIKFVIPHLGGSVPYISGRFMHMDPSIVGAFRTLYFDTASPHAAALRCMIETFSAERLMFGTDIPYLSEGEYTERREMIRCLETGDGKNERIRCGTALQVFAV